VLTNQASFNDTVIGAGLVRTSIARFTSSQIITGKYIDHDFDGDDDDNENENMRQAIKADPNPNLNLKNNGGVVWRTAAYQAYLRPSTISPVEKAFVAYRYN
jgi:hypothetical protein